MVTEGVDENVIQMEQALIEEYRDALPHFIQSFRKTSRAIIE